MPPYPGCPGSPLFSLICRPMHFYHIPTFVEENPVVGCRPGWMPGAVAPPDPALHATAVTLYLKKANRLSTGSSIHLVYYRLIDELELQRLREKLRHLKRALGKMVDLILSCSYMNIYIYIYIYIMYWKT